MSIKDDIINKILSQTQQVDDKLGGDGEQPQQKRPDSVKLLNLLDKVMDEWDVVQNKTKDKTEDQREHKSVNKRNKKINLLNKLIR